MSTAVAARNLPDIAAILLGGSDRLPSEVSSEQVMPIRATGELHSNELDTYAVLPRTEKPRVQSVARAIEILQLVAADPGQGVAAKDLANVLGIPRQVVYHLAHTLVAAGMLRKTAGSRYVLGLGLATIAQGFKRQLACFDSLGQYVTEAAAITGETAYVGAWIDGEIVARATARGSLPVHAAEVSLGTTGHAHARASGKLLLAMRNEDELEAYLSRHPMVPRTANTITTTKALRRELDTIRRTNVSIDREEYTIGLTCMAIPLGSGPTQGALGISAPTSRFKENEARYLALLREIVSRARA
ncbi:IclR family transcriptional regulator [Herbaspirillum frisingense]|uniref:IclR family transcriptional regulator n=1 Tax=Herbaspirillum frisingense TaxID=92645 RepID=UPI001F3D1515|nr:IclR family transcriptional regulator [Herbaspirillum frisingense]UIN21203.1 IclR family transcriptional regulator [Herbaspirillum frisingense]